MLSITQSNWLVQFKMNSDNKKSAHNVLFKNLSSLDDSTKWLSNAPDNRIVQFVSYPGQVIARLNKEPLHVICHKIDNTFNEGAEIKIAVKLCGSLERKKKLVNNAAVMLEGKILNDDEKLSLANSLLKRAGLDVLGVAINDTENIKFFKNNRQVQIKTFEAFATCKILDLHSFINAWNTGVGKRRTWGCGMLRLIESEC